MAGFRPELARSPEPRAAHRLVIFTLDAARCAEPAVCRIVDDAIATIAARVASAPGAADHHFAAVLYGSDLVRIIPAGTPYPWDLRMSSPGAARTDGATVALDALSGRFLDETPAGLPGSVDVLALVSPGDHVAGPDDLRILLAAVDDATDLAEQWWELLLRLRSQRRHTVLLK